METSLHRAAQYIAAAGIGYLVHEADDGHTTLTWDRTNEAMVGPAIPKANDISFALSIHNYALECRAPDGEVLDMMPLLGAEHDDLVQWFKRMLTCHGADPDAYRFVFHYELPTQSNRSPFPAPDAKELERLVSLRSIAHEAMEKTLNTFEDVEPVRIWPHHFDSGAVITRKRKENGAPLATIGIGLAIPDAIVPEHYLYVSPWQANGTAGMSDLPELSEGRWLHGDWNGAVLEAKGLDAVKASQFLHEASAALTGLVKA